MTHNNFHSYFGILCTDVFLLLLFLFISLLFLLMLHMIKSLVCTPKTHVPISNAIHNQRKPDSARIYDQTRYYFHGYSLIHAWDQFCAACETTSRYLIQIHAKFKSEKARNSPSPDSTR